MFSVRFCVTVYLSWQLLVAHSLPTKYNKLQAYPTEDSVSTWIDTSKQNMWELSGKFEGDMILSNSQRNGLLDESYRWKNREIPYEIDPTFDDKQREWITKSLSEISDRTCIKPRLRRDNDEDYVYITSKKDGCYSSVGRQGGRQSLNLSPNEPGAGCFRSGTVVHEFLHALGFYHQQSAVDRDDYVDIIWDNILEGKQHNFNKYSDNITSSFGEIYDYGSIMHYSEYAFSKNGEKTIVPKDTNVVIGQRIGLSDIDIIKLNKMYGCQNQKA